MDLLKELGLAYAESLPTAIGVVVGSLVLIGSGAYKVYESDLDPGGKNFFYVLAAGLAIGVVVQAPAAYSVARDTCRSLWVEPQGLTPGRYDLLENPSEVRKCSNAWPQGPN